MLRPGNTELYWLHLPQLIQWRFVCPAKNLSLFFRPSDLIIVSSVFARPPSCCRFYGEDKVYWWLKTRYVHVVITLSWTWTRIRQRGGKFRNYKYHQLQGGRRRNLRSSERRNYHWQWHWYGSRYYFCKEVIENLIFISHITQLHIQVVSSGVPVHNTKCFKQFAICCLHLFGCLDLPSAIQSTWTSEGLLVLSADTNPDPDSWGCPLILIFWSPTPPPSAQCTASLHQTHKPPRTLVWGKFYKS